MGNEQRPQISGGTCPEYNPDAVDRALERSRHGHSWEETRTTMAFGVMDEMEWKKLYDKAVEDGLIDENFQILKTKGDTKEEQGEPSVEDQRRIEQTIEDAFGPNGHPFFPAYYG